MPRTRQIFPKCQKGIKILRQSLNFEGDKFSVANQNIKIAVNLRPVSNVVLLPYRTQLIELNSTEARLGFKRRATTVSK